MDKHIQEEFEAGYIDDNLQPIKCHHCGGKTFKDHPVNVENAGVMEYDRECDNCKEIVGSWSYGHWQIQKI